MVNIEDTLKTLDGFIDNEYLDKYLQIIRGCRRFRGRRGNTNRHHVIPKVWFKLQGMEVNNDPENLVTIEHREHALAHYYLCLCTYGKLKYANEMALMLLLSQKRIGAQNKALIMSLPLYKYIYDDLLENKNNNIKLY